MARLILAAVLVALCAAVASADRCVYSTDARELGEPCDNGVGCRSFLYCGRQGVCEARVAAQETCVKENSDNEPCETGSTCRGPVGGQRCLPNSRAGEPCSSLTNVTIPVCFSGLNCDFLYNVCTGAEIGDYCLPNANVSVCTSTLNCTSNVCQGISSSTDGCALNQQCAGGRYCSGDFMSNGFCVPFLAAGAQCNSTYQCRDDLICTYADESAAKDPLGLTYCTERFSRAPTQYCDSGLLCRDFHSCYQNKCVDQRPTTCSGGAGCAVDERCMCGSSSLSSGVGDCAKQVDGCFDSQQPLLICLKNNCNIQTLASLKQYEGSCARRNCANELDTYLTKCSSAGRVMAGALFALFAAVVARFVSSA